MPTSVKALLPCRLVLQPASRARGTRGGAAMALPGQGRGRAGRDVFRTGAHQERRSAVRESRSPSRAGERRGEVFWELGGDLDRLGDARVGESQARAVEELALEAGLLVAPIRRVA